MKEVVNVCFVDFPTKARGMVTANADGSYTILLNSRLSFEQQRKAFRHEMWHIQNHDFERADTVGVQQIEYEAHQHDKEERGFRGETTVIQRDF